MLDARKLDNGDAAETDTQKEIEQPEISRKRSGYHPAWVTTAAG
jgi:hypothetical protein